MAVGRWERQGRGWKMGRLHEKMGDGSWEIRKREMGVGSWKMGHLRSSIFHLRILEPAEIADIAEVLEGGFDPGSHCPEHGLVLLLF